MPVSQQLFERGSGVQIHAASSGYLRHQQVLLIRHAFHGVVDHFAIAIKGEAKLDVAPDTKDGHRFHAGSGGGQPLGQRSRGVGAIQQLNHALGLRNGWNAEDRTDATEVKDQHNQHCGGDQAQP